MNGSISSKNIAVRIIDKFGSPCIPTDRKKPTSISSLKLNKDFDKALDFGWFEITIPNINAPRSPLRSTE